MSVSQEHFQACRDFQEYYDRTLNEVGAKAPAPTLGESVGHYRRETLRTLKHTFLPRNHDLYQVQMRGLADDALAAIEPQLLSAVKVEAVNPAHLKPGEIKPIEKRTVDGSKYIAWIGRESFVKQMMPPSRRVISFLTGAGRYDVASGSYK